MPLMGLKIFRTAKFGVFTHANYFIGCPPLCCGEAVVSISFSHCEIWLAHTIHGQRASVWAQPHAPRYLSGDVHCDYGNHAHCSALQSPTPDRQWSGFWWKRQNDSASKNQYGSSIGSLTKIYGIALSTFLVWGVVKGALHLWVHLLKVCLKENMAHHCGVSDVTVRFFSDQGRYEITVNQLGFSHCEICIFTNNCVTER